MRGALTLFLATPLFLLSREISAWGVQRNQTGLRIGQRQNHQYSGTSVGGGRGSGVRIGLNKSSHRNLTSSLAASPTAASSSTLPTLPPPPPAPPIGPRHLHVGLVSLAISQLSISFFSPCFPFF